MIHKLFILDGLAASIYSNQFFYLSDVAETLTKRIRKEIELRFQITFPFDLLDLVLPEIAHWMAGKSNSEKRRFRRAGLGLFILGVLFAASSLLFPKVAIWAFNSLEWAYFMALLFSGCGVGLLACIWYDQKKQINSSDEGQT